MYDQISKAPRVYVIPYGDHSPMEDHQSMEVAVDDETMAFYVHEVMAVAYGTDSIIAACRKYNESTA